MGLDIVCEMSVRPVSDELSIEADAEEPQNIFGKPA